MKIKSVSHYKGRAYCVETENEEKYFLHRDIIADFGICSGIELNEKKIAVIMEASYKRRAYERALYLLDYRDYSYIELLEKLEKNYPENICRETADRLSENGLINDRRYAENLAEKYCTKKKYGIFRAKQELLRHGIDSITADEVLEQFEDNVCENIRSIIEKKYASLIYENNDRKNIIKVTNALMRLGYRYDDIKKVMNDFSDEIPEEEY